MLSGLEHLIDGYVYQSDPNGIKVCWSASDPQSGITAIQYAVGTTRGTENIYVCLRSRIIYSTEHKMSQHDDQELCMVSSFYYDFKYIEISRTVL